MILLDTDVASFILKGDSRGDVYFERVKGQQLYVSLMTAAELYQWAELSHWGERRRVIHRSKRRRTVSANRA